MWKLNYNKKEVDDLIANVDVTEQMNEVRGEITKLDEKIEFSSLLYNATEVV